LFHEQVIVEQIKNHLVLVDDFS
jgi:hypothetical protein